MKFSLHDNKFRELGSRGASHIIVPLLAVVVMGVGGAYAVVSSHADPATAVAVAGKSKLTCEEQLATVKFHASEFAKYDELYYKAPAANDPNIVTKSSLNYDGVNRETTTGEYKATVYDNGKAVPKTVKNYGLILARQQGALSVIKPIEGVKAAAYEKAVNAFQQAILGQEKAITDRSKTWNPAADLSCGTVVDSAAVKKADEKKVLAAYKIRVHNLAEFNKGKKKVETASKNASHQYQKLAKAHQKSVKTKPAAKQ